MLSDEDRVTVRLFWPGLSDGSQPLTVGDLRQVADVAGKLAVSRAIWTFLEEVSGRGAKGGAASACRIESSQLLECMRNKKRVFSLKLIQAEWTCRPCREAAQLYQNTFFGSNAVILPDPPADLWPAIAALAHSPDEQAVLRQEFYECLIQILIDGIRKGASSVGDLFMRKGAI